MKQYLIYAGMFLGSFLVINVGMYFFLDMTQPDSSLVMNDAADSTAVHSDSSAVPEQELAAEEAPEQAVVPTDSIEAVAQEQPAPATQFPDETVAALTEESHPEPEQNTEAVADEIPQDMFFEDEEIPADSYDETADIQPAVSQSAVPEQNLAPNPKELAKLAKLLEGMKPAEAAAIASRLDIEEIVALVMKMKDRQAAKMMAELPVATAASVAQRMSELVEQRGIKS
jgi:flagellar motility protein MotE (MotC chaperone)